MIIGDLHVVVLVHHAMHELILVVQTIHLHQEEGDIPGQSHQETKGIGDVHTLDLLIDPLIDRLMHQEALIEVGVTAGA